MLFVTSFQSPGPKTVFDIPMELITADITLYRWFWEVTHAMTDEDKSKLLAFSTGCGRAPVGGMSEMNFIVVKNGGDSERYEIIILGVIVDSCCFMNRANF